MQRLRQAMPAQTPGALFSVDLTSQSRTGRHRARRTTGPEPGREDLERHLVVNQLLVVHGRRPATTANRIAAALQRTSKG
ncbi:hypothetical protein LWC34_30010 [Kibdelosporangium philippinense]|uniref:DUF5753 domain-containing protein n=2 Tax=Kibdelosporangium philippinense TaxID=211113 RepID=A0ABS8ZGV2_9PSEU|nr:hypothetical protein [Kibdelosporangium philippinense]MCE7007034.1 hypothetical protein [Kibdelosporangium philippinense]